MNKEQKNKSDFILDEVISPIFGTDFKNRIIKRKDDSNDGIKELNYLEHHVEMELLEKNKLEKNKQYQTKVENDCDILTQYQKAKSKQEIIESLPSNYLDFRDNLVKNTTTSLTNIVNDDSDGNTMSQIINDIFDKEPKNKD